MKNKMNIVEMVGFVSVVLSLLFLAYQIQRTNEIARVTAEIEIRNSYAAVNESVYGNPQFAQLLERVGDTAYELKQGEKEQLTHFAYRLVNIWIAAEVARNNDLLPQTSFQIVLDDIEYSVPFLPSVYQQVVDTYPSWSHTEVVKAIEKTLKAGNEA